MLDAVEDSRLVTIENCGHCPQIEAADRLADLARWTSRAARPGRLDTRTIHAGMRLLPDPEKLIDSAVTAWDHFVGPGVADLRETPSSIIHEGPQCTVHRYRSRRARAQATCAPMLLVPPLAAPATCFDLRRGCSLAEHFTALGYPTYLVDYGPISYSDRALGLEHWVEDVIPTAIRVVSEDAGGAPVQPLGWCLGGIMTLLAVAERPGPAGGVGVDGGEPVRLHRGAPARPGPPARQAHRRARSSPRSTSSSAARPRRSCRAASSSPPGTAT